MTQTGLIQLYDGSVITKPFDVRRYGTKGDGVTDDTAAINAAAADASAAGGELYFPPGKYLISDSITLPHGVTVRGDAPDFGPGASPTYYQEGHGSILYAAQGTMAGLPMLDIGGTWSVTITGMAFVVGDGQTPSGNTTKGISDASGRGGPAWIDRNVFLGFGGTAMEIGSDTSRITRNTTRNCSGHLVALGAFATGEYGSDQFIAFNDLGGTNGAGNGIDGNQVGHNTIIGNDIFNCNIGVYLYNASVSNRVEGNRCEKHNYQGILVADALSDTNLILGNVVFNNGWAASTGVGISITGGSGNRVMGNVCTADSASGAGYNQTLHGIVITAADTTVQGNTVAYAQQGGIFVSGARCAVVGNQVFNGQQDGIDANSGATGSLITDNIISQVGLQTDNTYTGIVISDSNISVRDNTIRTTGAAQMKWGIRVSTGVSGVQVTANDLIGAGKTAALSDAGTNTLRRGNRLSTGATQGIATLAAASPAVTIATAEVQTTDVIVLSRMTTGGTAGFLSIGTISAGTSFTVVAAGNADTSTVAWEIIH